MKEITGEDLLIEQAKETIERFLQDKNCELYPYIDAFFSKLWVANFDSMRDKIYQNLIIEHVSGYEFALLSGDVFVAKLTYLQMNGKDAVEFSIAYECPTQP